MRAHKLKEPCYDTTIGTYVDTCLILRRKTVGIRKDGEEGSADIVMLTRSVITSVYVE